MARVAAAVALLLLAQGAFAAPSCGCGFLPPPVPLPTPLPTPCGLAGGYDLGLLGLPASGLPLTGLPSLAALEGFAPGYGFPAGLPSLGLPSLAALEGFAPGYGFNGLDASLLALGGGAPLDASYLGGLYPGAGATFPVGAPSVEAIVPGPPSVINQGPFCKTSVSETPVTSGSTVKSGPVQTSSAILDGFCSTSCPATRAKCGGTTKNVAFKTPKIINKGSKTYSTVSAIGAPVTTRATKPGTPLVDTKVTPGPVVPPTPVPAPGAYPYDFPFGASSLYGASGLYGAGLADLPFVAGLNLPYPGAALVPEFFGGYPGFAAPGLAFPGLAYPGFAQVPTSTANFGFPPSNCACACAA